jgi:hypothetical protein
MFSRFKTLALGLAVAVCLGSAGSASADEEVPFKGLANAVVTGAAPVEGGIELTADATGLATHLGLFTRQVTVVIDAFGGVTGTITFVAANGDELYADALGGFTSPTTAEGAYTFTGGTGRFANASGSAARLAVTSDGIHIALTFEGTIAF